MLNLDTVKFRHKNKQMAAGRNVSFAQRGLDHFQTKGAKYYKQHYACQF